MLTSNAELVKSWMSKAGQLTNLDNDEWLEAQEKQLTYVEEEFYELMYAFRNETRSAVLKEACDLLWVTYGLLHTLGVDPDTAFDRIYTSNCSKFPFSKVNGKVQKGPNYKPAELDDL
jgi:predicted HAD superfamily Cof-like phosphohydrolase